ncbi:Nitrogen assimilation transcription factor nit-4-like protein 11, partial [Colletotrichum chlorophyti]
HQWSEASSRDQKSRRVVQVACEGCRKRKTKCSSERPRCSNCASKGLYCRFDADPSETWMASLRRKYEEATRQNNSFRDFFEAFLSVPEAESHELLRKIRTNMSVEDVLRQMEQGGLLLQLSSMRGRERYASGELVKASNQLSREQ